MKAIHLLLITLGSSFGKSVLHHRAQVIPKCSGVCLDGSAPLNGGTLIPMLDVDGNGKIDDTCLSANANIQNVEKTDPSCQILQLVSSVVDCGCLNHLPVCSPCYGHDTPDYTKNISEYFPNSQQIKTCADLTVANTVDSFFSWIYRNANYTAQDDSLGIPTNTSSAGPIDSFICRPFHFIHAALCRCLSFPPGNDPTLKTCELCPSGYNIGTDMTKVAFTDKFTKQPVLCGVAIGQLAQFTSGPECDENKKNYADEITESIKNCCIQE